MMGHRNCKGTPQVTSTADSSTSSGNTHQHFTGVRRRFDNFDTDNKKVRSRSCRESLLVCLLLKPQYMIKVAIFGILTVCFISVAFRLQADARQRSSSLPLSLVGSRVLYNTQQPPTMFRIPVPTRNSAAADSLVNDAGYASRPRVVGCYWPDDYDEIIDSIEDDDEAGNEGAVDEPSSKDGASLPPKNSNKGVPLAFERLDANLIRPLTDRSIYLTKDALKAQMHLQNSKDYRENEADPFEEGDCKAQYDWQKTSYPTCNNLHEQAMYEMSTPRGNQVKFLAYGYWRDVFMVRDADWEPLALKMIRYEHDYVERNYDRHRRDAVAMEHLSSSPNVVSIYGFCGNSGIFEFASGGSLEDAIWYSDEPEWNSTEKLIVAYQVASGLADLHNSDKEGVTSISHTDITPSQFVFINKHGRFLLNDFNRCRFIRWNEKKHDVCPFHVGNNPGTVSVFLAHCFVP